MESNWPELLRTALVALLATALVGVPAWSLVMWWRDGGDDGWPGSGDASGWGDR